MSTVLTRNWLFNKKSISIFTDSSYTNYNNLNTACPGYCIYWDDILIEQGFDIKQNTSSQRGELYAILMGIYNSYKYRNYNLRLFSDSQTSIYAIRHRIFNWVNKQNQGQNILGDNGCIQNQDIIMDIIYTILNNNVHIEFYHVKGHVKSFDKESVENAKRVFISSNIYGFSYDVDDKLINCIIQGNNQVDKYTGFMLDKYVLDAEFNKQNLINGITPTQYGEFDIERYKELTRNRIFNNKKG